MRIKNQPFLYVISIVIAFGSFVFGYSLVCISMMSDNIRKAQPIDQNEFHFQLSLITTLLPLGAFLGSFLLQPLCEHFGQNKAMLILDVFGTIAILIQSYRIDFWSLYIGRLALGIYVGIASGIIPTYLISISPPQVSGIIGSLNQLLITIGIAVAYGLGMIDLSWETYMTIPAMFCAIRFITLIFFKLDRLQRHYSRGESYALQKYLDYFYENGSVDELGKIRNFNTDSNSSEKSFQQIGQSGESFIWRWMRKLTSNSPTNVIKISLVLALANQFSGINAILFYAKQVFEHITSNKKELANQYTFYLGLLQVFITFGSGFLINRFGRRTLMLVGETIIVGSLLCGFMFDHWVKDSQKMITFIVFTHIIGFSISLGPVSMLYVAQMMENITLVVCAVWIFTLFVSMVSEIMINTYGIGNVFLFYGLISLGCLLYLCFYMVESRGLSRKQLVAKISGKASYQSLEDHQGVELHQREGQELQKNDTP